MRKSEMAAARFSQGYNCAQAVIGSFCNDLSFDQDMALKIATGFGAGMGRKEEVCGAVSGGIMVIGIKYGRGEHQDSSFMEQSYQKTRELMERFKEKHDTWICRQLLGGCELMTFDGQEEFRNRDLFDKVCQQCVRSVVEILEELLKSDDSATGYIGR